MVDLFLRKTMTNRLRLSVCASNTRESLIFVQFSVTSLLSFSWQAYNISSIIDCSSLVLPYEMDVW